MNAADAERLKKIRNEAIHGPLMTGKGTLKFLLRVIDELRAEISGGSEVIAHLNLLLENQKAKTDELRAAFLRLEFHHRERIITNPILDSGETGQPEIGPTYAICVDCGCRHHEQHKPDCIMHMVHALAAHDEQK